MEGLEEAKTFLREDLKEQAVVVNYAKEVLEMLSSDDCLGKTKKGLDTVAEMRVKMDKTLESLASSTKTLKNNNRAMQETILTQYRTNMSGDDSQPDPRKVMHEINDIHKSTSSTEQSLKKLENEKKILKFHEKYRQLQLKIANVQFDLDSSKDHIKGYIVRPEGGVQTFEFDLKEMTLCDVSDSLWDSI